MLRAHALLIYHRLEKDPMSSRQEAWNVQKRQLNNNWKINKLLYAWVHMKICYKLMIPHIKQEPLCQSQKLLEPSDHSDFILLIKAHKSSWSSSDMWKQQFSLSKPTSPLMPLKYKFSGCALRKIIMTIQELGCCQVNSYFTFCPVLYLPVRVLKILGNTD